MTMRNNLLQEVQLVMKALAAIERNNFQSCIYAPSGTSVDRVAAGPFAIIQNVAME